MVLDEGILRKIVTEELSKSEVSSMIASRLDSKMGSQEFKKLVRGLAADVVNELFKILWQRNTMWKSSVSNF